MTAIRWAGGALAVIIAALAGIALAARFGDGPTGPLIGGELRTGDWVEEPVNDWSFAAGRDIELQLDGDATSRTTWFFPAGKVGYIPAGQTFPPGKQWHQRAAQRGAAVIRIDDRRYPVRLDRLTEEDSAFTEIAQRMKDEGSVPPGGTETMWLFVVRSRPQ
ncbi:MAG: hypothetical protein AAF515_15235 [Pseudomonadota bacterium]